MCSLCRTLGNGLEKDSANYTFVCCKAFESDRKTLVVTYEPRDLVHRMLESPTTGRAVVDFAEAVIGIKEEADRAYCRG